MSDLKTKIIAAVKGDLAAIEAALEDNLNPYFDLVSQVAGHILFAGGKRLRPLLMIQCARLCGHAGNHAARFATIFEYLHAATLLHDDLVDGADMRRGRPVANQVWDNPTAVLTGDFLLARGLSIAADTGLSEVIRVIAGITENMSQGEIRQMERKGDSSLTEAEYLEVIRCKTAVLFEGACRTGALIADAGAERVDALTAYGYHLGIAFQMADDLLDYTQDLAALGKRAGADLREGKLTLPLIHALSRASEADRERMVALLEKPDFCEREFAALVAMLDQYGGIAYTRAQAAEHVAAAKTALGQFAHSRTRETLMDIADYALVRKA
ncbi:octaprenyl diphosphate synthase [Desulfosarcina ovata subsp. sediminis]|uniref:Octaprenyl diphosphate synthase n=1 Tax=Desulfosarcina ovata subsp. sediminis TaxID=885957 RepID=A0A5K7ZTJ3_9BACT|nr:polyprenyl synthetase family protein [Desulfosarcina ovata]BBO83537.1 octaprenyl diphosphate synthase [Desulfosarcina ovata subsp. sediminis]